MIKKRFAPLIALGAAAGIFTIGVVNAANAQEGSPEGGTPKWAQEQLLQEDAIALWDAEIADRLASVSDELTVPEQSPGILRADHSEEGENHKVYYERGLVENLLARYTRCATLELAQDSSEQQLARVADLDRPRFSDARGVKDIMDTDSYFVAVDRGAAAEGISPASFELNYMCDVLTVEKG